MSAGLTIIGAGPGGLAPLFAAASAGTLQRLLSAGVVILEQSQTVGSGLLRTVTIHSDSAAEAFLDILAQSKEPELHSLLQHPVSQEIAHRRGESVPLALAAKLIDLASEALLQIVDRHPRGRVLTGQTVLHIKRRGAQWETTSRGRFGKLARHTSSSVHLATGAHQPLERLQTEPVGGRPLLPAFAHTLMQTGELFTEAGAARLQELLFGKSDPKVVIVGGSTSAGAAAAFLLRRSRIAFGEGGLTLMHRSPLHLYYASREEAQADGYSGFGEGDLCPITGRVFRLSGFRFESKDVVRNALCFSGEVQDKRLTLFPMAGRDAEAQRLLAEADVIIAALGYIPRMCNIRDEEDQPIALHTPRSGDWAMVDQACTVLSSDGTPIPGLTAMGLAIGPAASREMGGELDFKGQVNSLWLWQNRLGLRVVTSALNRVESAHIPFLRPQPPRLSDHLSELQQLEASNTFTNFGPINTRFENALISRFFDGTGACTTTSNATLALMVAIKHAVGESLGQRRFALMPSFTFAAAAQAALWCGLTPLFCDIDPETWLPCHNSEDALIATHGESIAVVVPNATFGNCLDLSRYESIQRRTGIPVVIDAAAALGSLDTDGRQFGTGCHLPIVFSMHATKPFATGEGGVIYSADADVVRCVRAMSSFGFESSRIPVMLGLNAKLSEVAALTAALQLDVFPDQVEAREQMSAWYTHALPTHFTQQRSTGSRRVSSFQSVLLPAGAAAFRESIRQHLTEKGIQTGTYFSPHLAQQSYMQHRSFFPNLPVSDSVSSRILSLPLLLGMSQETVAMIAETLQASVETHCLHPEAALRDTHPSDVDVLQTS